MTRTTLFRLALTSLSIALMLHVSPALAEAQKIGVVGALNGNVSATGEDGQARALKAGDAVFLNDAISSGANSKAQIMFLDKSSLMINPDSKVMVDKFIFNPATSTGELTIQNTKGALRFIGGALSKEKPVTIKTPVATIGIRGGIADTHVAGNGATDAIFVYGEEMTMTNASGQTSSVTTPGQGLGITTPNGVPTQLPPERVMQHLQSFSSGDSGDMGASGNEPGDGAAPQGTDGQNPDGNNNENAADNSEGGTPENQQGESTGDQPNGTPDQNGAPKENNDQGNAPKGAPPGPNNPPPPNGGANGGFPGGYAGGNPPPPPGGFPNYNGGFPNAAGMLPPIVNTNLLSGSTQAAQTATNTAQYNVFPEHPDQFGRYVMGEQGREDELNSGTAAFERVGVRQNGRLTQTNPNGGIDRSASLPWLTSPGFHGSAASNFILVDGKAFNGQAFISDDLAMNYYQMQEVNGQRRIGTVFGRQASASNWAASSSASAATADNTLVFYDFLPDLHQNGGIFGFFDYNVADSRLVPAGSQVGNLGMAVDWGHQRFLTGHLIWESDGVTSANPLKREMILAFGRTNDGNSLLDGRIFEFGSRYSATGADQGSDSGFIRVIEAYSATNGAPFSGFLAEGIMPNDDTLTGGDNSAFGANVTGDHGLQPLVVNNTMSDPTSGDRTTQTTKGFAAGYLVTKTVPSSGSVSTSYTRYANANANDVQIATSASTSNVIASFHLEDTDDAAVTPAYIDAKFGNSAGGTAESAFLTDDLYAAAQSKMSYGPSGGGAATDYVGNAVDNSAIAAASVISDVGATCDACEFVGWGVWAGEVDRSITGTEIHDEASMIPYVAGQVTQNLTSVSALSLGNVTYDGVMYGHVLNGSALTRDTGSFTAGINLNTRKLTDFNAHFADMNFGFTGQNHTIAGAGNAEFNNISVGNLGTGSPGGVQGFVSGALFGPQAEDLAGNFAVNNVATGAEAAGVYIGTRE